MYALTNESFPYFLPFPSSGDNQTMDGISFNETDCIMCYNINFNILTVASVIVAIYVLLLDLDTYRVL